MITHVGKTQGSKSQSTANSAAQKKGPSGLTRQQVDNRPKTAAQRHLQKVADTSPRGGSPGNPQGKGLHPLEKLESMAGVLIQDVGTKGNVLPVYIKAWEVIFNEFQPKVVEIGRKVKGVALLATLKQSDTAKEKIKTEYAGESNRLVDIGRATIMCKTVAQVIQAYEEIKEDFNIVRIKNRFATPAGGYRDMLLNVKLSNGHIAEIQIHLEEIALMKEKQGHKLYEIVRVLEPKAKKGELTPDEAIELDRANLEMKKLYDEAWEKAKAISDK